MNSNLDKILKAAEEFYDIFMNWRRMGHIPEDVDMGAEAWEEGVQYRVEELKASIRAEADVVEAFLESGMSPREVVAMRLGVMFGVNQARSTSRTVGKLIQHALESLAENEEEEEDEPIWN